MTHYAHIENEAAYEAAKWANIRRNRAKTARANWLAAHDDAQTLHDWLFGYGEFADQWQADPRCSDEDGHADNCSCKLASHPLSFYARGDFLDKMRAALNEWGGLSDGQHAAVAKSFARAQELLAGRDVKRAAQLAADAQTSHVGTVGERRDFDLTAERVHSFDGQFGTTYITIFRDGDNNVVVYKGSIEFERGEHVRGKATVKAHEVRDGVPQTIIARPKFEEA